MPDICTSCNHPWHGMACQVVKTKLDKHYNVESQEECGCPSNFVDKYGEISVLEEGPRTVRKGW